MVVIAFVIAQGPSSAADVDVVTYYTQHGDAAIWQAVLAGFGLICFVWFAATFAGWSPAGSAVLVSAAAVAALYSVALGAWESLGDNFKDVNVVDVTMPRAATPISSMTSASEPRTWRYSPTRHLSAPPPPSSSPQPFPDGGWARSVLS
jgi:hypothetical protein